MCVVVSENQICVGARIFVYFFFALSNDRCNLMGQIFPRDHRFVRAGGHYSHMRADWLVIFLSHRRFSYDFVKD